MKIRIALIITFWFLTLTTHAQLEKRDTSFVSASKVTVHAEIGRFRVPENRQQKTSRLIDIRFVRLKSSASVPGIPLVYLEGGSNPCTWQAEDPDYLEDWRLQSSPDMTAWTDHPDSPATVNGFSRVLMDTGAGRTFFRLVR